MNRRHLSVIIIFTIVLGLFILASTLSIANFSIWPGKYHVFNWLGFAALLIPIAFVVIMINMLLDYIEDRNRPKNLEKDLLKLKSLDKEIDRQQFKIGQTRKLIMDENPMTRKFEPQNDPRMKHEEKILRELVKQRSKAKRRIRNLQITE